MDALHIEESLERNYKNYKEFMDFYKKESLIAKTRGVTEMDLYALGEMLSKEERMIKFAEANSSSSSLGVLPQIALDIQNVQLKSN